MNSRFHIPSLMALGLGILSGCGGSGSSEQAYLPIGLQRTVDITLQDGSPYIFSFIIASASTAVIYSGNNSDSSTASYHVINYNPASDSAEQIGFDWSSSSGLNALVVLYNPLNISKGTGSATCSVKDADDTRVQTEQDNRPAVIGDFKGANSDPNSP